MVVGDSDSVLTTGAGVALVPVLRRRRCAPALACAEKDDWKCMKVLTI